LDSKPHPPAAAPDIGAEQQGRLFQPLIDALPSQVALLDGSATIVAANEAWKRFARDHGGGADADIGRGYLKLQDGRHPPDAESVAQIAQGVSRVLAGELEKYQIEYACHVGAERFCFLLSVTPLAGGGPVKAMVAHENVTAPRLAETEFRLAAATFESMQCAMIVDERGSILRVNPAFTRLTGYTGAEAVGNSAHLLHRADDAQDGLRDLLLAVGDKRPGKMVLRNYRKDGSLFWNELSISPVYAAEGGSVHFICVLNDVTAQKDAEQHLMAWALRLDALTSMSEDGLIAFDENGALSFVNDAFLRLSGLQAAQLRGIGLAAFEQIFAGQCDPRHPYRSVMEDIAGPATSSTDLAGDETEIHLLPPQAYVLLRRFRKASHGTSLLLYYHDITRARNIEDIKSEFLATAAHELRTPMASIFGYTELLLLRTFEPERSRELLEIILRQSRRVTELLNELLDLARIEARRGKDFKRAEHDLRAMLNEVAATFTGSARRIVIVMPATAVVVSVDKEKMHQALINLLGNALKFSPVDQAVTVSVKRSKGHARHGISITIQDHGIGMTPAHVARFGERFFRADPSGSVPGTGLGVSLAREILNLHGGTLAIESEFGKGSCVTLWLPLAAPAAPAPAASHRLKRKSDRAA